ncbi:MAG: GTP pyrophosphokinase family protein [Clostridia bacterium]|nr:GTP pyrophosphokinase family protein [Clostridia bacterium]
MKQEAFTQSTTVPQKSLSLISTPNLQLARRHSHAFITLMSYYKCAMMEVETKLNVLNEEFSLRFDRNPINSIKSRLKSPVSIEEKLASKNLPMTLQTMEKNLNDIAGVRVICSFLDDIYLLAECLLSQDDITLIAQKDYISHPKENGYRSLHLIVQIPIYLQAGKRNMRVEIQLRTIAMDCWASLEHQLRYKKDIVATEQIASELQCCANMSAELDARMDHLRRQIIDGSDREKRSDIGL